jgi:hypothetical protein
MEERKCNREINMAIMSKWRKKWRNNESVNGEMKTDENHQCENERKMAKMK